MKRIFLLFLLFFNLNIYSAPKKVKIKVATLAPKTSYWYDSILKMSAEINKKTEGRVSFVIYAGGVAGDESDMIRKMRINQIHASIISFAGVGSVVDLFKGFWFPLFFDSLDEVKWFYKKLEADFNKKLKEKKFRLLMPVGVGSIYWFSKKQIKVPSDLKSQKIFVWAGDFEGAKLWKKIGFKPVPLSMINLASGLKTGLVEAFSNLPVYASVYQLHNEVKFMLKMDWSFALAGFLINESVYQKISVEDRKIMMTEFNKARKNLESITKMKDKEALSTMKKQGLTIHIPSKNEKKKWINYNNKYRKDFRGTLIPGHVYDRFMMLKKLSKNKFVKTKRQIK